MTENTQAQATEEVVDTASSKTAKKIKRQGVTLKASKPTEAELKNYFAEEESTDRTDRYIAALDPRKAVKVKKHPSAKLPEYQTELSAGCDVCANLTYPKWLEPGQIESIPTGLSVAIPPGYELQVRSRSGLAKKGIVVANGIGTIDADFRGEIHILLLNVGKEKFQVDKGMRIAQLVLSKVDQVKWEVVESLDETERGTGGFGSTGV